MTESEFKNALAEFTTKTAGELAMTDDLEEIGVDSIGVFEFMMKIEDTVGKQGVEVTDSLVSVQDLYDRVQEAAERQHA
ncbi:acyl carrier protein [Glycomyces xiaoerkulensis]|uniref:acyl carrier protein n=1 Tax=Glycomyces xiaoerkulensis TaxID=2038139 RepID=UPI000C262F05|nr:acyl carrier protein [Glycomyces xiaoerkulensis]